MLLSLLVEVISRDMIIREGETMSQHVLLTMVTRQMMRGTGNCLNHVVVHICFTLNTALLMQLFVGHTVLS